MLVAGATGGVGQLATAKLLEVSRELGGLGLGLMGRGWLAKDGWQFRKGEHGKVHAQGSMRP